MDYSAAAEEQPVREIDLGRTCFPVFRQLAEPREQTVKVLEEAAELLAASRGESVDRIIDEACDIMQAMMNLLAWYGVTEVSENIDRMIERNERRGREYA